MSARDISVGGGNLGHLTVGGALSAALLLVRTDGKVGAAGAAGTSGGVVTWAEQPHNVTVPGVTVMNREAPFADIAKELRAGPAGWAFSRCHGLPQVRGKRSGQDAATVLLFAHG